MTKFQTKAKKTVEFHESMLRDNMLGTMNPEKLQIVESFVKRIRGYKTPDEVMAEYHLKMVPVLKVWARTRDLLRSTIGLLESWSTCEGNAGEVQAETGVWLLGENEEQDLERLQKLTAGFMKFYKAEGLPPALRKEQLAKQLQEHLHARKTKPVLPPREKLLELQAEYRDMSAHCDLAWHTYHDHLDGYFGRKGEEAARKKAAYGYDRSAGYYHPSKAERRKRARTRNARPAEQKPTEPQVTSEPQAKPSTLAPTPPGPVASGAAGREAVQVANGVGAGAMELRVEAARREANPS